MIKGDHVNNLAADDPLRLIGENTGKMFTFLVETLRNPKTFPDPIINKLMGLTWELVGNLIYPAAVGEVPTLSFFYKATHTHEQGAFICPKDWVEQCHKNRFYTMSGLVWAGSQARDAWNGKMKTESKTKIMERASAYEAQYLLTLANHESFVPNQYQQILMKDFPKGIETYPELIYTGQGLGKQS